MTAEQLAKHWPLIVRAGGSRQQLLRVRCGCGVLTPFAATEAGLAQVWAAHVIEAAQ